jgi:putative serine protease PepD
VTVLAGSETGSGNGSGQLIRDGGYVLTNDHVISSAASSAGGSFSLLYSDGRRTPATIVGRDVSTDLAVLKAADGAEGRPTITVGSSDSLRVGQPVVALGAPLGLSSTVTAGIVSALGRLVPVPADNDQTAHLVDAVQTDASINPGNSGGALVDCSGALVGVNTAIATVPNEAGQAGGGSVGLGFAIPVDLAVRIGDQLIETGSANHPDLGLQAQEIPPGLDVTGLFVTAVAEGGPAAAAGIEVGDVITSIDGRAATSTEQLTIATLTRVPGDTLPVTYVRSGTSVDVELTL